MTVLATSILISLIKIAAVLAIVFTLAPLLVWAERRQSAVIQDRVGPVRASIRIAGREIRLAGLLHPLADTLKMMWKEDFVPPRADKFLHSLAPIAALVPALMTLAVLPFGNLLHLEAWNQVVAEVEPGHWCVLGNAGQACVAELDFARGIPLQIASLDVGILFLFAIAGTGVVGAAIGGYASDNKYSLLGGLRAAGQMVSYEVVLGLTLVGCFMIYGSLRLEEMVRWQRDHAWGIVVQPVAALLYLTAAIAETKRIPFDVPEGESEIVGGYFTEYSGMKFGMFFMGEFIEVVVLAALATSLFFGGWSLPFLDESGIHLFGFRLWLPHLAVVALQFGVFMAKLLVLIWLQLMLRWSLPRFRYDQIMRLCWRYLLPLTFANIVLTALAILLWPS